MARVIGPDVGRAEPMLKNCIRYLPAPATMNAAGRGVHPFSRQGGRLNVSAVRGQRIPRSFPAWEYPPLPKVIASTRHHLA